MVKVQIVEREYNLDVKVLPRTVTSVLQGNSLPLILSAEEVAEVIRKRTVTGKAKRSYYQTAGGGISRTLIMLDKMYTTGHTPVGYDCNKDKVLDSIKRLLNRADFDIEKLSAIGKVIALKYID